MPLIKLLQFTYNFTSQLMYLCNFNKLFFNFFFNFSRSVAGPSKDLPPDPNAAPLQPMIEPPLPDCLKFESRFESGNLAKVIRITEAYYELYLRPDYYTSRHCQWFYFQVSSQCGKCRIFLSLRFYVKSILGNVEVQNMPF